MVRAKVKLLYCLTFSLFLGNAMLATTAFLAVNVPVIFEQTRLPLGEIRGVLWIDSTIWIASADTGRLIQVDANSHLISWIQLPKRPIWLVHKDNNLIVQYTDQSLILDANIEGRLRSSSCAQIRHSIMGHPYLVIRKGERVQSIALQPWYLTAIQLPWPAGIYILLLIVSLAFLSILYERRKHERLP